jgi:hypothetical protein
MKKAQGLLAAILLFLTACNAPVKGKNGVEYKSAVAYNDYIVNKQDAVIKLIMQFAQESQTDLNKADQTIDKAVVNVDQTIKDIEGMPEWKGNTTLRDDAISLFKFYKKTFSEDYKRIIAMQKDGEVTNEEAKENEQIVSRITNAEAQMDAQFKNAQREFASKNGFRIGENEMQGKIDEMKRGN